MDYLKKQNESHKIGDVLSTLFLPVQGLSSSQDDCRNAHIVDEKLHLSPERVWLALWPQDNDTGGQQSNTSTIWKTLLFTSDFKLAWGHNTRKRWSWDSNPVRSQLCQAHTSLYPVFLPAWVKYWACIFFLRIMESLLLISFDQLQAYVSWSKQALICRLNSYLMKKSFSQRSNKVCKEIALLKRTFNLHCQIAHWFF